VGPAWAYAFLAGTFVTLAGTPLLRRLALATEFVDHPVADHKSHHRPTPYLGGLGLIVAVLVGLLFADRLTPQVGVVALGGSLIGCLGLLDDHRSVGALFRFLVEMGVAAVALAAGLRIHATDVPAVDGALTLVWIVGVTNAVNLLDNMDGLAAGVSAAAAVAIFALAILGEQLVTATLAAGLAGACVGFLAHNKRPASIFMGDTGSLFLGFVLALAAIDVSPALRPPDSFAVPLILMALPVLDTATVTVARMRRGRPVSQGGKDHLSHRLVARGMSPGAAVGVLVATEAVVGLAAVLAGREVVPLPAAVVAAAAVLAALASVTLRAAVYTEPVVGLPRRVCLAAVAGIFGIGLLAAPAAVSLARARRPGIEGADKARLGLEALEGGDAAHARVLFDQAATELGRAQHVLGGRLSSLGLLLPGLRANLATTRALVAAGDEVSRSAATLSAVVEARSLPLGDGPQLVAGSARLAPALAEAASAFQRSVADLAGYDRPYLWPSLGATVRRFRSDLLAASGAAATEAEASGLAPALLGAGGPRHYFVAVEDNTELRGAGGVVRWWGEITAEDGRLRLSRFGPVDELNGTGQGRSLEGPAEFLARYRQFEPATTWQNVDVSPDFSVTGQVIGRLYPQSGGREVDGVVAVDIPGLAALLGRAGDVRVDGWPDPVSGANLADIVLRGAAQRFPDGSARQAFLAGLYRRTLDTVLAADLGTPAGLARALAPAVRGGHLLLYASRAEEERLFERLGAAGHVPEVAGDSLLVVNQNLTATPVDSQLRRRIRYDVSLDPGGSPATLTGQVEVTLANDAADENRSYLSVYSPFGLADARPDVVAAAELGRRAYSATLSVPSGQSSTLRLSLEGRMELADGNWYRLDLPHQPSLNADETEISLSVPPGWRIADVRGPVRAVDDRHASARMPVSAGEELAVQLERTPWSRLWARIRP
jgi:UDP-GlcNAc:undecaprenyl-phosphate GlcNAc-1-phosphate transferase